MPEQGAGRLGGAQRQAAFYSHGRQVICTPCADEVIAENVAVELLEAHYFAGRAMLCGHCHQKIGPWSPDEIQPDELVKAMALYEKDDTRAVPDLDELVERAREVANG